MKPDYNLVIGDDEYDVDSDRDERVAEATLAAKEIVGSGASDEFQGQTARLIFMLSEDQPGATAGVIMEQQQRALSRRACLLICVAEYHAAALKVGHMFRGAGEAALVPVFKALGYGEANSIVSGIKATMRGCVRDGAISPSEAMLQAIIVEPARIWLEHAGEFPEGPCAPDDAHCLPGSGSGAEYVFRLLDAANFDITREAVEANLDLANELLAELDSALEMEEDEGIF